MRQKLWLNVRAIKAEKHSSIDDADRAPNVHPMEYELEDSIEGLDTFLWVGIFSLHAKEVPKMDFKTSVDGYSGWRMQGESIG